MGKYLSKSKSTKNRKGFSESRYSEHVEKEENVTMGCFREYSPVHQDDVMSVDCVASGLALSGSKDKRLILYNHASGEVQQTWSGHEKEITKVRYGKGQDAFFSSSRDKTVCMWKRGNGQPHQRFIGHDLVVNGLTLNSESTQVCTGSRDNTVRIWDVESAQCLFQNTISRNLVTDVCWGKNSHIIAQSGEDKDVRIWDARNLQVSMTFQRKMYIQNAVHLSEDNNFCLSCSNGFGGNGCEATLWDMRTGKPLREFKSHQESIGACLFLPSCIWPNTNLIATCSNDCSVKLWNLDTAACITTLHLSGSGPLTSMAVDQDNLLVSTASIGVNVMKISRESGNLELIRVAQY